MKTTVPLLALLLGVSGAHAQDTAPKPAAVPAGASYLLPDGRIALHGSEAMAGLVDALDAKFVETHPGVTFAPLLKGSGTAMPALSAGATPIAFVVGESALADRRAFRAIAKHDPVSVKVGYAGYGPRDSGKTPPSVYVNASNPLQGLTMAQLAGLFTSGSPGGDINTWSQLGVGGAWGTRRIHLYGLRDDGDFSTTMRLTQLGGMPFAGHYEPLPDDAAVVQAVASDPYGIAIVGWQDPAKSSAVRVVALAADKGRPFVLPDKASIGQGIYPLATPVTLYFDRTPKQPIAPFVKDYLSMVLSADGQAIIARFADSADGFLPLSPSDLQQERQKLND
jgi:phosphate transport system substrate-binding protein